MNKLIYRIMSVIVLLALSFGSYTSTGALAPATVSANTYYVSVTGNDTGAGTSSAPFKTIQKCLNVVVAGDTCLITAGIYNEALTLKTSGTASQPIALKCATPLGCTVNSGNARTLVTGGRIDYYTIEGFRFISNYTASDSLDGSLNFQLGAPWSRFSKTNGNHGFILRDCYIEGNVHFYGHNNLVENCEFDGKNQYQTGISDGYSASYDNTYRNNIIYNYTGRAVWSMESTDNILIEGNTIHDTWGGPDCDGAAVAVTRCKVINNHIYNVGKNSWAPGIFLENCFDCLIQGNTVHDIKYGTGIYAINYGNGSSTGWHTYNNIEYRNRPSGMIVRENVVYNSPNNGGMFIESVSGMVIDHNTFYVTAAASIEFRQEKDDAGVAYPPINETITNNIYKTIVWRNSTTSGLASTGNFTGDPTFVNPPTDLHLKPSSPACTSGVSGTYAGVFPCGGVVLTNTPTSTPSRTPTAVSPFTPTASPLPISPTPTISITPTFTPTPTAISTGLFGDIPDSYWAKSFIERLYYAGITGGCSTDPLNYCPEATVTRAQMAIFILRGMYGNSYTPPAATGAVFSDVPLGSFADAWIEQLALEGVTAGCGDGIYCPGQTITRAQMAIFLLRGKYGSVYTPPAVISPDFSDVPPGSFADAWIEQLALEGVTAGCGGGNYCPDNSVTRAEMAVFLVRTFNLP